MIVEFLEHAVTLVDKSYKIVCEFGVYNGVTVKILRDALDSSVDVYGFDSFEGLPEDWVGTGFKKGYFTTDGVIPEMGGVKFYKGWFCDTIDQFIQDVSPQPAALIHIDCDLYSSTKEVLDKMLPYITKNTILVFDEWIYNSNEKCNDHEQRAFFEWAFGHQIVYEMIEFSCSSQEIVEKKLIRIISAPSRFV